MNSGDVAATDGRAAHPAEGGLEEVSEPRWASGFVWKAGSQPIRPQVCCGTHRIKSVEGLR